MKEKYRPISCSYYDELEARATRRTICTIRYLNEAGAATEVRGRIIDFFIQKKVEFLRLDTGLTIRLDRLLSVDGLALSDYC